MRILNENWRRRRVSVLRGIIAATEAGKQRGAILSRRVRFPYTLSTTSTSSPNMSTTFTATVVSPSGAGNT